MKQWNWWPTELEWQWERKGEKWVRDKWRGRLALPGERERESEIELREKKREREHAGERNG